MITDDYRSKQSRSPSQGDLRVALRTIAKLEEISTAGEGIVTAAAITVESANGYVIGEVWWDPESEVWRLDLARYGEES